jgi:hypothetical protein
MRGVILAWAAGMGIITWRSVVTDKSPPVPGQMLAATGLFALLALIAEYQPAEAAATLFAFGVDIAVLMQVLPGSKPAAVKAPAANPPQQTAAKTGGRVATVPGG